MISTNTLDPIPPQRPKVLFSSHQDMQAYLIASKTASSAFVYFYRSGEYIDRCLLNIADIRSFKVVKIAKSNKVSVVFIAGNDAYLLPYRLLVIPPATKGAC